MPRIGSRRFWSKCLSHPRPHTPARTGGAPSTRRSPLLRRQSGFLDDTPGCGAILDQEAGKFLRRVQDRLQRTIDELRLAERGLVADASHVFPDLVDDRLGRACRGEQAEIDAREIAAIAEFRQRRNVREQRRALGAVDRQARHRAALQMGEWPSEDVPKKANRYGHFCRSASPESGSVSLGEAIGVAAGAIKARAALAGARTPSPRRGLKRPDPPSRFSDGPGLAATAGGRPVMTN